ncbi:MAG: hypothetical protein AAF541_21630 [Pseudomonadota bacterium]
MIHRTKSLLLAKLALGVWVCFSASVASALDAREYIARAKALIQDGQYSFARRYLDPAVIAPFISSGERAHAYYLRGYSFRAQGLDVSALRDFNRALEFDPDNATVLNEVGFAYAYGRGVTQDKSLAYGYFDQAATRNSAEGHFQKGHALLNGAGVKKNVPDAREALSKAAAGGHNYAMLTLASSYREPHVAEPQAALAQQWYERAWEAGVSRALWFLGRMHEKGELGEPDPARAVEYYLEALDQGVAVAGVSLAYAYLTGTGVAVDEARAFALYEQAAAAGLSSGQVGLGHMYEHGIGIKENIDRARSLYIEAANRGDRNAQRRLVTHYLSQPSLKDRGQALQWSAKAAGSGDAQAQNDYAWLLATSKYSELRNGVLAVNTALQAVAQEPIAAYLDTLAAAYAEAGNFEKAVETQQRAIEAISTNQMDLMEEFQSRLRLYQESQPWRE